MVSRRDRERAANRALREQARRDREHAEDLTFTATTGRPAPARSPDQIDSPQAVRDQLTAAYGKGRGSGPDTGAAARALGVSRRTVQRWLRGTNSISPANRTKLQRAADQVRRTKAGRRRAVADQPRPRGQRLKIRGNQGPMSDGVDYSRDRTITRQLTAEDIEELRGAYAEDGHTGAMRWIHGHLDQNYVDGWRINRLDDFDLD